MVTELLSDLGCLNHLLISQGIFMLNNKSTNQRNQLSIPFRFSTFYHASFAPVKLCSSSESGKKRSAESSKKPRAFLFQSLRRGFVKLLLKLLQNKTVFKHSNCDSLFCWGFTEENIFHLLESIKASYLLLRMIQFDRHLYEVFPSPVHFSAHWYMRGRKTLENRI